MLLKNKIVDSDAIEYYVEWKGRYHQRPNKEPKKWAYPFAFPRRMSTNLFDKNWVEIYRGDLVQHNSTTEYYHTEKWKITIETNFIGKIVRDLWWFCEKIVQWDCEDPNDHNFEKWKNDKRRQVISGLKALSIYDNSWKIKQEVIGNIYEHSHLLSPTNQ